MLLKVEEGDGREERSEIVADDDAEIETDDLAGEGDECEGEGAESEESEGGCSCSCLCARPSA